MQALSVTLTNTITPVCAGSTKVHVTFVPQYNRVFRGHFKVSVTLV